MKYYSPGVELSKWERKKERKKKERNLIVNEAVKRHRKKRAELQLVQ